MVDFAANLRRLMARLDLTVDQVVEQCSVDERTIRTILAGTTKPHARTLHRLAAGLQVPSDEFFQDPSLLAHRTFDRKTNPVVEEVIDENRDLFAGWTEADFDELYSRFGMGGSLTYQGTVEAAGAMNRKRQILRKAEILLEGAEAELVSALVNVLYERITVT